MDEKEKTETVEENKVEASAETEQEITEETAEEESEDVKVLKAKLKAANHESAGRRKRLEALEAAEKERQEAAMSEAEKLQKRAADLEAENKKLKITSAQISIATEVGLPLALADRLIGETEEEIRADAEKMLALIPAKEEGQVTKKAAQSGATKPGSASQGETVEERRKRLLG